MSDDIKESQDLTTDDLIKQYTDKAYSIALKFTGNTNAAWDLVQDAFVKILRNRERYIQDISFDKWLYVIIRNLYIDGTRTERKYEVRITEAIENLTADKTKTPLKQMEKNEIETSIQFHLMSMEPILRITAVLVDIEGYSYKEAASILECPIGTVCMRLYRARRILKEKLSYLLEGGEA